MQADEIINKPELLTKHTWGGSPAPLHEPKPCRLLNVPLSPNVK